MKRPLGTIGLTFLTVLAVAFYFDNPVLLILLCAAGLALASAGIFLFFRGKAYAPELTASGAAVILALFSIFLYQNYYFQPLVDNYSDKEISISGYVCDEIITEKRNTLVPIQTYTIDGENKRIKINLYFSGECGLEEFDKFSATLICVPSDNAYNKSKGIFFTAYQSDGFEIAKSGEKHFGIYNLFVGARKTMKSSLDSLLGKNSEAICKAVLFGDKSSLNDDIERGFNKTGTSFLIVVSGLHLSIVITVIAFLLRLLRSQNPRYGGAVAAVLLFTALSGFTPSVMRAAITSAVLYIGYIIHKSSDGINSLGLAALVLTVGNPFSVGNMGMLLSFSAVFGINLWGSAVSRFIQKGIKIDKLRTNRLTTMSLNGIRLWLYKRFVWLRYNAVNFFTELTATSVCASLWVAPITILGLGEVSPIVVLIALITEPIASLILILAIAVSLLNLIPFLRIAAYPPGVVTDLLAKLLININSFFAGFDFSEVKTTKPYWYIWLGVTAALVIIGLFVRKKRLYVPSAIMISAAALLLGWSLTVILTPAQPVLTLFQNGSGLTATVTEGNRYSVLSLGGRSSKSAEMLGELKLLEDDVSFDKTIDKVIVPNGIYNSTYLYSLYDEFEIADTYFCGKSFDSVDIPEEINYEVLPKNCTVEIELGDSTADTVVIRSNICYQYLRLGEKSVLLVPRFANIEKLPEEYRRADVIVLESVAKNIELLRCDTVIYTGSQSDKFKNSRDKIEAVSNNVITLKNEKYEIK